MPVSETSRAALVEATAEVADRPARLAAAVLQCLADIGVGANGSRSGGIGSYGGPLLIADRPGEMAEVRWILGRLAAGDSPTVTVEAFASLLDVNRITAQRVTAVWGLNPASPVGLADGIRLVSLNDLPLSPAKEELLKERRPGPFTVVVRARAAIVQDVDVWPLYLPAGQGAPERGDAWEFKYLPESLCALLVLLTDDGAPVVRVAEWTDFPPGVPVFEPGGYGGNAPYPQLGREIAPTEYDPDLARSLTTRFLALERDERRRMLLGCRRLSDAALWDEFVSDIAINLGVSLEAFLSDPKDPSDGIGYRLRTRAGRLLGGAAEHRDEVVRQVKRLYEIRSAAAHGSDVDGHPSGQQKVEIGGKKRFPGEVRDELDAGRRLAVRIARTILLADSYPDFYRQDVGP